MTDLDKYKRLVSKNNQIISSADPKLIPEETPKSFDPDLAKRLSRLGVKIPGVQIDQDLYTIIAFDTTGSMSDCIDAVRKNIREISHELLEQEDSVQIMLGGVGEYCDIPYTLQLKDFRKDPKSLERDIEEIRNTPGGGACQVSLELLFRELNNRYVQKDKNYALVVFTDQIAHGQDNGEKRPRADYKLELEKLKENLGAFYIVNCGDDVEVIRLQRDLLDPYNSNEKQILLEDALANSKLISSLIIAMVKRTISVDRERDYLAKLKGGTEEQRGIAEDIERKYLPF